MAEGEPRRGVELDHSPAGAGKKPLAGLDRGSKRIVRRLAWHFAQRHWGLHFPAVVWMALVFAHTRYGVLPARREYFIVTGVLFVIAVVNIRLHIRRQLPAARAVFDMLGAEGVRRMTGR
jgi:cobalamin biosynthesis protein CobD/CbiB